MSALDFDLPPALPGLEPEPGSIIAAVREGEMPTRRASRPRSATRRDNQVDASPRTSATREATAAKNRVGGDHPVWFWLQVAVLLVVIAAGLTISASALVVVGGWQHTPDGIDWVTVAMIDGPMLAAFLCAVTFKWRGHTGWLWGARIFGGTMTVFSASANFAYTVSAAAAASGGTGLDTYQEWVGALAHASAPVLVFVCFEFFGHVITRPKRNEARLRKLTVRELRRVEKELKKRLRDVDAAEAKALRG